MSAVDDVYAYLGPSPGVALAGAGTAWDLQRRRITDAPEKDQVVVVSEDGGPPPGMKATAGVGDVALVDAGVHVSVRASQWDGDASKAKALAILTALHGQRNVQLVASGVTYYRIRALTPEPVFAGFDVAGRPRHTVSFRLLAAS